MCEACIYCYSKNSNSVNYYYYYYNLKYLLCFIITYSVYNVLFLSFIPVFAWLQSSLMHVRFEIILMSIFFFYFFFLDFSWILKYKYKMFSVFFPYK